MLKSSQSVTLDASHYELIEAMTDEVVILDATGEIVAVNMAWKIFCEENGGDAGSHYVGANYFDICKAAVMDSVVQAETVLDGLRQRAALVSAERQPHDNPRRALPAVAAPQCHHAPHGP